ncbi:long-chain-fatty-acid--CoA ligase [Nakamurella lactea]|uniref:long-chain-fatty-acid--CoA ligase n=1 Tax=Nakamurella lactea TaxID=459515 RepID=UPI0004240BEE|nr:long-chain fatty acid--CoA ligase [Nakamurella lactea]
MANLARNLLASAARVPDRPAIIFDDVRLTFADLDAASARMAGYLTGKGLRAGDRVALMLPNVPAFAVIYYGVLRIGGVVVPMNPLLKLREIEHYLGDSGASMIFALPGDAAAGASSAGAEFVAVEGADAIDLRGVIGGSEPVTEVTDRDDADTAVILYTSGTTGKPKGAELTHANLDSNQRTTAQTLLELTDNDVVMGCLPLFHVFGMTCGLNAAVAAGAALTLIPRFDPSAVLDVIARDRVTVFEGVPTMYAAMLAAAAGRDTDLSSLRTSVCGGSSLPVEVLRKFEKAFGCMILEGYGLSETSPVASFNHPDAERKAGSIGFAIRGCEMAIMDESDAVLPAGEVGEIVIRGENIMRGYWNNAEATAAAIRESWFHSGDLGRQDDDGYFYVVDRKKDMIIRAGMNVYPREVEEVLYEHPAIAEAAVVGTPDPMLGEEIAAYVVLAAGASAEPAEISQFVKDRLAAYKYPRKVTLIDALPKTATGKILKRELRD